MKTYNATITQTDQTQVCADTVEEAEKIAFDIFKENGYNMYNAEFDTEKVSDEEQ